MSAPASGLAEHYEAQRKERLLLRQAYLQVQQEKVPTLYIVFLCSSKHILNFDFANTSEPTLSDDPPSDL